MERADQTAEADESGSFFHGRDVCAVAERGCAVGISLFAELLFCNTCVELNDG